MEMILYGKDTTTLIQIEKDLVSHDTMKNDKYENMDGETLAI